MTDRTTHSSPLLTIAVTLATLTLPVGCRSFAQTPKFPGLGMFGKDSDADLDGTLAQQPLSQQPLTQQPLAQPSDSGVRQVSAETPLDGTDLVAPVVEDDSLMAKSQKSAKSVVNFITGKEQEDRTAAKEYYQQGDQLFRQASNESADQQNDADRRKKSFKKAGRMFRKAAEAAPKTAIEQDALFMQAESLFFADELMEATEAYQTLQKEHPRNRHNDQIASRLFSISRYWIETAKADKGSWAPINLTDASKPRLDADGHAIRVLDNIRYDDPTGRLADDATMAAAAEYLRQEKFEEADEFLTDLRETFSDSEHLFLAHLLGIRTKLQVYAGPRYSGLVLEEAEKLVQQTRTRFPDKLAESKYAEMVARAAKEIAYHKAERLAYRADFREKRKEYGAARFYYRKLLEVHGDTPFAETARKRLEETESLPPIPTQRLSWLTTVFPDSNASDPLIMESGAAPTNDAETEESSGTMLR